MSYGKHPFGKYALWSIVAFVGSMIIGQVMGNLPVWVGQITGTYDFQYSMLWQIMGGVLFFAMVLLPLFSMFMMYKAYKKANAKNIPQQLTTFPHATGNPNTKYCLNCGAVMPSVANFCGNCGAKQIPPPP